MNGPPPEADFLPFTRPVIDEQTIAEVSEVLRSGWITSGPKCLALEAALSQRFAGRPVRLASSATAALELALRVCGVGPGDEVITTPLSWFATANVILAVGARPVFVDVDPVTRNIDLALADAAVTPRTRAIVPVDLGGLPVDRDGLQALAARHGLRVIEDAAQSFGARWAGREIGSSGDVSVFSFHANKSPTTGEGGCAVFTRAAEAKAFAQLRMHGVLRLPDGGMDVVDRGAKANLTDIAAAIGLGQLRQVDGFTARRRSLARRYFDFWRAPGFDLPPADTVHAQSSWHMFQPLLPRSLASRRAAFIDSMRALGFGVGVHYPAMHLFTLFRRQGWRAGQLPVAEDIGARTITLPLFGTMEERQVERVCAGVACVAARLSSSPSA